MRKDHIVLLSVILTPRYRTPSFSPPFGNVNPLALVTLILSRPFFTVGGAGVLFEAMEPGVGVVERDPTVGVWDPCDDCAVL
jgi:hypothetical protein